MTAADSSTNTTTTGNVEWQNEAREKAERNKQLNGERKPFNVFKGVDNGGQPSTTTSGKNESILSYFFSNVTLLRLPSYYLFSL